uniref:Uncharacterized protein n=1 Tax=Anguilla anguilla TaxID=7936 RepID=A0A0E9PVJ2_ANGAN
MPRQPHVEQYSRTFRRWTGGNEQIEEKYQLAECCPQLMVDIAAMGRYKR